MQLPNLAVQQPAKKLTLNKKLDKILLSFVPSFNR
jgi:hypothetical protein